MRRIADKATTLAAAWEALFGASPSVVALVNAMAVAELETRMGDAWPGENNWGAVHKRALSASESQTLAAHGVVANGTAEAPAAARALLVAGANEALHEDRGPHGSRYFVWFWAFPTPLEGARKFLETLVGTRPGVRDIIDTATPDELARAMYATRYYEGVHTDAESNIRDYAAAIRARRKQIETALGVPTNVAPPRGQGSRLLGAGVALAALAVFVLAKVMR